MAVVFLATFVVLITVVAAMAIGVIVSDRRIAGSCGGLSSIPGIDAPKCECKTPCKKRLAQMEKEG